MHANPKDISPQRNYLLKHHPHPNHIRDKEYHYLYMNLEMDELFNVPADFPIAGKGLSGVGGIF